MTNTSSARFLGHIISEPLQIVKPLPLSGYSEKEETCKGCMGPCGRCEDGNAPEPDPEELPDMEWAAQKTEYEL